MTTTQANTINWSKTRVLSLDRRLTSPTFHEFIADLNYSNSKMSKARHQGNQTSLLYLKRNLDDSGDAVLNFSLEITEDAEEDKKVPESIEQKRTPFRKISFKCKKPSYPHHRRNGGAGGKITSLNPNTVAELTSKFNEIAERESPFQQTNRLSRLVRRVNSQRLAVQEEGTNKKVARKPSVKLKAYYEHKRLRDCDNVSVDDGETPCVSILTKTPQVIGHLEDSTTTVDKFAIQPPSSGSVRAAIEIFERHRAVTTNSQSFPTEENKNVEKATKPKVPEKNPNIRVKDLVIKDGVRKLKIFDYKRDITHISTKLNKSQIIHQEAEERKTELEEEEEKVEILNIPLVMPRRCDSMYETLNLRKIAPPRPHMMKIAKSEGEVSTIQPLQELVAKPNMSFLWRQKSQEVSLNPTQSENDGVESDNKPPAVPPRPVSLNLTANKWKTLAPPKTIYKKKMPLPEEEKIYEELADDEIRTDGHDYEYCRTRLPSNYEDLEQKVSNDGYEYFESVSPKSEMTKDDVHESLLAIVRKQEEPLPPRPPSGGSYDTIKNGISNCYESIYNLDMENNISDNYESIYGCQIGVVDSWESASNVDSMVSCDQQSNSLYGRSLSGWQSEDGVAVYAGKASSDLSGSDKSDEWIDLSDNEGHAEDAPGGFVIVRERQRNRKTSGWSQKIREQWNKSHSIKTGDSDSDHHYESLYNSQDHRNSEEFDSFESDTESETSMNTKFNQDDSGIDINNLRLPEPPSSQTYGLTKLAVSAGKHMKRLRRNWSLTKSDITKSFSRIAKRKSRSNLNVVDSNGADAPITASSLKMENSPSMCSRIPVVPNSQLSEESKMRQVESVPYQNIEIVGNDNTELYRKSRSNSLSKKTFLHKFRRSVSSNSNDLWSENVTQGNKAKSTFYLTDTICVDVDDSKHTEMFKGNENDSSLPFIPMISQTFKTTRPQSPPPPIPTDTNQNIDLPKPLISSKRTTSWYAECGLFRNSENGALIQHSIGHPNTSWYAEIGLYQTSSGNTSTNSSAENSGNDRAGTPVNPSQCDSSLEIKNNEDYYNVKNETDYYNENIAVNELTKLSGDIQLRLQDEPLYQFYDAAVLESVCQDGTGEFDYDGYEEVGDKTFAEYSENRITSRPSAMQLISPSKNGTAVVRTLWCEVPEVVQSAVLSTLSLQQKKLQEAKFEMMTSEASYLNSLNVLNDHFIINLVNSELLADEEKDALFGKIQAVKRCSERLLSDLEKCWQDNVLLYGICGIVQKQAEENFYVYVSYCENQIFLESTLRKIKERSGCHELLKQLECSSACQLLSLHSFLMLPMQRITRWPLLVDAVLKRLLPQDDEYLQCQYALATVNKIVMQCNEAARRTEREIEMKRIATQIEFPKGIPPIRLASGSRWLIRSGTLTQMLARADDTKLTFGKRFSKVPLCLFLFNDLLLVTKPRNDDCFLIIHYCFRSYIELNTNDTIGSLPLKDAQGRHLLLLTVLENHHGKTVEMLLSCTSESDKERWIEALSAPKSEDPDETLYECWDCPQVTAIHGYNATQPDELALSRGDIVNVTRKMADGWYHGERIRDGQIGWFPANYTAEVANPHVRARNLKQRYRLLAFSENYLKSK